MTDTAAPSQPTNFSDSTENPASTDMNAEVNENISGGSTPTPPSILERLFSLLSSVPVLVLLAIVALQTYFVIDTRELWFSDEIRYANVFENVIYAKKWLVLYLNGIPYPDKPPVYFWLLSGIYNFLGEISPKLFFIGAAVSGGLLTLATYALARTLGENKKTGLLAGLVLTTTFYAMGVFHYSRMDLLFGTLITLSHLCLFKGWKKDSSFFWVISGFAFAGLATLTKGPLGLAFPILSMVLFLVWRFRIRRLGKWDVAVGAGIMAAICLGWAYGAYMTEDPAYMKNIIEQQIIARAMNTWHHDQPWWHYFATLPAALLPWTFILFVLPWTKLFTGGFYKDIWASRQPERMGVAYLWISVLSGFALLSALSIKIVIYLIPLFPHFAILTARGLNRLPEQRCRVLFRIIAGLLVILGIGVVVAQFENPWGIDIAGYQLLGGSAVAFGALLWILAPRNGSAGALLLTILLTLWIQPLAGITAPSLDKVMSPKAQALVMRDYIQNGYHAISYKIYSGTYTYYAQSNIQETNDFAVLDKAVEEHPDLVVAIRKKHWDKWEKRPEDLTIIHRQFIVDHQPRNEYLLAVRHAEPQLSEASPDGDDKAENQSDTEVIPPKGAPKTPETSDTPPPSAPSSQVKPVQEHNT